MHSRAGSDQQALRNLSLMRLSEIDSSKAAPHPFRYGLNSRWLCILQHHQKPSAWSLTFHLVKLLCGGQCGLVFSSLRCLRAACETSSGLNAIATTQRRGAFAAARCQARTSMPVKAWLRVTRQSTIILFAVVAGAPDSSPHLVFQATGHCYLDEAEPFCMMPWN